MANRVEVTSAGYGKRKVTIRSDAERDISAVVDTADMTAQLEAADAADAEVYGKPDPEQVQEGPPADVPVNDQAGENAQPAEPEQAQTEPAPDQGDQAQTEQPPPTTPSEG